MKLLNFLDSHFFTRPTHPINLAIFRIVFALTLFFQINWNKVLYYIKMPENLRFPPIGLEWFVNHAPITSDLAIVVGCLYYLFSFCLLVGFFSRTAALGVAVSGFYILGIESFFGSVSHSHHHIILFSLVLAFSRCGDALAIDSKYDKWVKTKANPENAIYTLPVRLIWLIFGTIYFFPGFWKLVSGGIEWITSDNLKYQLHHKWFWTGWTPFIRIDNYPFLYKIGAFWTVFFEFCFIFLLFVPGLMFVPVALGFFFHTFTALFMGITFWSLAFCYVIFFDWHRILQKIGAARFFSQSLQNIESPVVPTKQVHYLNILSLYGLGMCLITTQMILGFNHCRDGWPFSCYPTFRSIAGPKKVVKDLHFLDKDKQLIVSEKLNISFSRGGKSMRQLVGKIIQTKDLSKKKEKLQSLVTFMKEEEPQLKNVAYVQVLKKTYSSSPDASSHFPLKQILLEEYELQ